MPKPALARGTRDFLPHDLDKRNYLFGIITSVFRSFGYQEIQTPSFEKLETLTGKYGEEGDRLIFKILNSGDFFGDIPKDELEKVYLYKSSNLIPLLSEKALRYDLTVPLARFVVQHQHELTFPFKRFQIQPVWRADRPQKGRFREFYQCDADVVGSKSLYLESELLAIYAETFRRLGIKEFRIRLNHRKFLVQMFSSVLDNEEDIIPFITVLDKLDKIGLEKVKSIMLDKGMTDVAFEQLAKLFNASNNQECLLSMRELLDKHDVEQGALNDLEQVLHLLPSHLKASGEVVIDPSLARGLDYYTGCIFEIEVPNSGFGSLGGGGRYDELTEIFGLKEMTGVGISFGAERILEFLEENQLFPTFNVSGVRALICSFEDAEFVQALAIAEELRKSHIAVEVYPEPAKLKKQLKYANAKGIPVCLILGRDELIERKVGVKNMTTGEQKSLKQDELISFFKDSHET